jgi:S-layer protein
MAATDYTALVQQLYVSYFGRPADTYGLQAFSAQLDSLGAPTTIAALDTLVQSQPTGALAQLVNSFSASPESVALYGSGNSILEISKFVNAIYNNVLHRDADTGGGTFWINAIMSGNLTKANAAMAITNGALANTSEQGLKDAATVKNTLSVATEFTSSLDSIPKINAYAGNDAAALARGLLLGVSDTTVVADYQVKINDTITTLTAPPSVVSVLTDAADTFVGTAANDVINATDKTFTALDNINGGTGVNTLNIVDVTGASVDLSIATVTNIQKLNITSSAGLKSDAADVSAWTSLTSAGFTVKGAVDQTVTAADTTAVTVTNTGAGGVIVEGGSSINVTANVAGDVTATTNAALASAVVKGGKVITITDGSTSGTVLKSVSLNGNAGAATLTGKGITTVSLANTNQSTTIANSAAHAETVTLNKVTGGTITDAGATSLTLNAVATKSAGVSVAAAAATSVVINAGVDLTLTDLAVNKATSIALTGAGVTTINGLSAVAALTAIDATAAAGGVVITPALANAVVFTGGAGNDTVSVAATTKAIALGAGDDTIVATSALGTGGSVNGGDGVDTIAFAAAALGAVTSSATKFTNFETLKITDVMGNGPTDVSGFAGVVNFVAGDGVTAAATATVTGLGANTNVTLTGDLATNTGTLAVALKTDTAADTVNLTLAHAYTDDNNTTAAAIAVTETVTAANVETLNVTSTSIDLQTADHVAGYKADVVTNTLVLSDDQLVTLNITGDKALVYATAGTETKLATIDASANTAGVDINASAAVAGSAALTIKGSATAGNANLTGGATVDTIIGGAKADNITGGANGDTLTGGAGNDIFHYATGDSQIGTGKFDTITDFSANTVGNGTSGAADKTGAVTDLTKLTGDALAFVHAGNGTGGIVVDVQTSAADATTFLANNKNANTVVASLDAANHNLYVDNTGDGVADFYIHLTGVSTITSTAFILV